MHELRWLSGVVLAGVCAAALTACGSDNTDDTDAADTADPTDQETTVDTTPGPQAAASTIAVGGTDLYVEQRGNGRPLLLIHGGGEDASMLSAQADDLASAGYRVITYDRRGTGRSGRDDWPGDGADQHADDDAALLAELDTGPAVVVGVSSGAVIALALVARHPDAVDHVIAWEPPALGVVPGAEAINAEIMAPVDAHLSAHPGDYVGAQAVLLTAILGVPVAVDDPAFAATRANAEAMIRGEPSITLRPFPAGELTGAPVTVAVGSTPNDLVAAAAEQLAGQIGRDAITVDGDHEVYLTDPAVLTGLVSAATARR